MTLKARHGIIGRLDRMATPRVLLAACVILAALAVLMVFSGQFNHDAAYYVAISDLILAGDRLFVDIIDTNPPLVFHLTLPPVIAADALGISPLNGYRLYMLLLIAGSVMFSLILLDDAVRGMSMRRRTAFALGFIYTLMLMPGYDFGQREHILVILALPWLLVSAARAGERPVGTVRAVFAGLFAGIGISLKPHFLLLPVAVEAVVMATRTARSPWKRPEALALAGFLAAYALYVAVIVPEYFASARVFAAVYSGYDGTLAAVLRYPLLNAAVPAAAWFLLRPKGDFRALGDILAATLAALIAVYAVQYKGWSYHYLPAQAAGDLLLLTVLLGLWARPGAPSGRFFTTRAGAVVLLAAMASYGLSSGPAIGYIARSLFGTSTPESELIARAIGPHAHGKPVLSLSTAVYPSFPAVNHVRGLWVSPLSCLLMLPGSYDAGDVVDGRTRYHTPGAMNVAERFMVHAVLHAIERRPPAVILVDRRTRLFKMKVPFDLLDYFMGFGRFREMFADFRYGGRHGGFDIYIEEKSPGPHGRRPVAQPAVTTPRGTGP